MRIKKFVIERFRSIEKVEINFPEWKPVILLWPNNVWKSNILKAMDCLLGEKYTPYIDFQDSDHFLRNKKDYPNISFSAFFDRAIKTSNPPSDSIQFTTNYEYYNHWDTEHRTLLRESTFHFPNGGNKMYLSSEDRDRCSFVLVDASRDIGRQLSYFSQYSVLSKMSKRLHAAMKASVKEELDTNFKHLKATFEKVPEYTSFHEKLQQSFQGNIDGFEHKLEIDLSAYDPNNYFHSLRIIAKEGTEDRSFEEFGTWEQQILLMSFVKAYAETFKSETFILGIEEPEAHLHPIAQRWLAKNVSEIAKSWVQVIVTTHSPDFLDIDRMEGFVRAYKEDGITKVIQHDATTFAAHCIAKKAKATTSASNIAAFYKVKTFYDQMRGFFARKILLVEGETEFFALPNYFENCWYDPSKNWLEIVNCRWKWSITRNYRLFTAFWYQCYCLFDADSRNVNNDDFARTFSFDVSLMELGDNKFTSWTEWWYFGKDFETYLRNTIADYSTEEAGLVEQYGSMEKPMKAKAVAECRPDFCPWFVEHVARALNLEKTTTEPESSEAGEAVRLMPEQPIG